MRILVFVSSNCPHCPKAEGVVREIAPEYSNYEVSYEKIRTRTSEGKDLSIRYGIRSVPTILFLDEDYNELKRIVGAPSGEHLKKEIEKLLGFKKLSFFEKLLKNKNI